MANVSFGVRTVCPFYVTEAPLSITCEGLTGNTVVMTKFRTGEEKRRFQTACCERYDPERLCPLAAALMRKYD